jgi:hypothetical protein
MAIEVATIRSGIRAALHASLTMGRSRIPLIGEKLMRVRLALLPIAAAAVLLAGCATTGTPATAPTTTPATNGVEALAPADIITKAKAALTAAKSFHVKGGATDNGTKADVDLTFQGKNQVGTISASGVVVNVEVIGTDLYLKAPDAFWQAILAAQPSAASTLASVQGKWVKVSTTTPGFSDFADLGRDGLLETNGDLTKGAIKTVNGTQTIPVVSADKSVVYVAIQGEPYPIEMTDAAGTSTLDFSQFNSAPDVTAPAAADVFDLKALLGG